MTIVRLVLAWFASVYYALRPVLKSPDSVGAVWERHKLRAVRRLGTVAELRGLLERISSSDRPTFGLQFLLEDHCHRTELDRDGQPVRVRALGEDDLVGDPKDVSYLFPPRNLIGYSVETTPEGYVLEHLETRKSSFTSLRVRGTTIGWFAVGIVRQESYGPMHVI